MDDFTRSLSMKPCIKTQINGLGFCYAAKTAKQRVEGVLAFSGFECAGGNLKCSFADAACNQM